MTAGASAKAASGAVAAADVILESFRVEVTVPAGRPEWLDEATLRHLDDSDFRASVESAVREVVARLGLEGAEVRLR